MISLQIMKLKPLLVFLAVAIATPAAFADDWRLPAPPPPYRLQNNGFDSSNQDSVLRKPDKYAENPQVDAEGVRHFANGKHFDLSKMSLDDAVAQTNASTLGAGRKRQDQQQFRQQQQFRFPNDGNFNQQAPYDYAWGRSQVSAFNQGSGRTQDYLTRNYATQDYLTRNYANQDYLTRNYANQSQANQSYANQNNWNQNNLNQNNQNQRRRIQNRRRRLRNTDW